MTLAERSHRKLSLCGDPGSQKPDTLAPMQWVGESLVTEGRDPASERGLSETLSMDGETLTILITASSSSGTKSSKLLYRRSDREPPCTEWSTPCKSW